MEQHYKKGIVIFSAILSLGFANSAKAAVLSLTPSTSEAGIGQNITLDLRVDSEGVSMNGAQATIRFLKDNLEVISLEKTNSALSFWLVEPVFSNADGTISLAGGTPFGVSGASVQILTIKFKTKTAGSGPVSITEAAVTASDGSGTNILSKTKDAIVSVLTTGETPVVPKIPTPQQIVRVAIPSENLPAKPVVRVPLYPDGGQWHNVVSPFTANWDLPADVSGISTSLNNDPKSIPGTISEGLFDSKTYDVLTNGSWYLHVRFKNNVGWGPTTHYKIAIDIDSPLGFAVSVDEGDTTDNPQPTLRFKTSDAISGLKEYRISIDNVELPPIAIEGFDGSFKLPEQAPGKKRVSIKAIDLAGNGVENIVNIEILPIVSPVISFAPTYFFPEEGQDLVVRGTTVLPELDVLLQVREVLSSGPGQILASGETKSNGSGSFDFSFGRTVPNGKYVIVIQSRDARGALSLPVESGELAVKSKPIIQIGAFQLDTGGAAIFLLLILVVGFGAGIWFYRQRQEKLALRVEFTELEVSKMFKIIADDIDKLYKSLDKVASAGDKEAVKRLQENISKMEIYIKKGIDKIRK